jgi:hypothetical protein
MNVQFIYFRYVPEKIELSVFDPMYRAFANVFENFRISDPTKELKVNPLLLKKVPKIDLIEEEDLEVCNFNLMFQLFT